VAHMFKADGDALVNDVTKKVKMGEVFLFLHMQDYTPVSSPCNIAYHLGTNLVAVPTDADKARQRRKTLSRGQTVRVGGGKREDSTTPTTTPTETNPTVDAANGQIVKGDFELQTLGSLLVNDSVVADGLTLSASADTTRPGFVVQVADFTGGEMQLGFSLYQKPGFFASLWGNLVQFTSQLVSSGEPLLFMATFTAGVTLAATYLIPSP